MFQLHVEVQIRWGVTSATLANRIISWVMVVFVARLEERSVPTLEIADESAMRALFFQ